MVNITLKKGEHIYQLLESVISSEDFGMTKVYGISIIGKDKKAEITDISDNFNFVNSLFELIAEEELYPEHLNDVVEDFLSAHWPRPLPLGITSDNPSIA